MKRALLVIAFLGCSSKPKPVVKVEPPPAAPKSKFEIADNWWLKPSGCPSGLEIYKRTDMIACLPVCPEGAATSPADPTKECGRKYGPAVHLWPDGKVAWHGWFDNDARTGPWRYHYHSGELFAKGEYDHNDVKAPFKFLRRDGKPFFFETSCPAGTKLERSDRESAPAFAVWCEDASGKQVAFAHWNGDSMFGYTDAPDGNGNSWEWDSAVRYYEGTVKNGAIVSSIKYELGDHPNPREYTERNPDCSPGNYGAYKVWDRGGKLRVEGQYKKECRDGDWKYRDANGDVVSTTTYASCKPKKHVAAWHCTDAKHLLRPEDLAGKQVSAGRIDGVKETATLSTVQLRGTAPKPFDVTLRLIKSNPEDYSNAWSDLYHSKTIEVVSQPGPGELADGSARVKVKTPATGGLGFAFHDQWLGAAVLVTCAEPACATHEDVIALAKIAYQRLATDRGCKK